MSSIIVQKHVFEGILPLLNFNMKVVNRFTSIVYSFQTLFHIILSVSLEIAKRSNVNCNGDYPLLGIWNVVVNLCCPIGLPPLLSLLLILLNSLRILVFQKLTWIYHMLGYSALTPLFCWFNVVFFNFSLKSSTKSWQHVVFHKILQDYNVLSLTWKLHLQNLDTSHRTRTRNIYIYSRPFQQSTIIGHYFQYFLCFYKCKEYRQVGFYVKT